jgi:hypothetical protein
LKVDKNQGSLQILESATTAVAVSSRASQS